MRETGKQVVRNSLLRTLGYALGAAIQFACIILIGRYLGTEKFGVFAFISAFVGIFQLLADMGVRNILIRNIAVDLKNFREHLGIARTLLWILSSVTMVCIVSGANILPLTGEIRQAIYLAGLAVLFTFNGLGYSAVLRAFQEMGWDILGFVLHKVILIGLMWSVAKTGFGLRGVFAATLLANGCLWLYFWILVSLLHGRARVSVDVRAGWALLSEAFPLGIAEILRRLKQHVDKLLLAALGTPVAVGLFSAAYKFLEAATPFTTNLTLPLFPVFSKMARSSPGNMLRSFEQSMKFLYVMGAPLAIILFVFSEQIVLLCFGKEYLDAALTLKILAPAVFLLLPTSLYGYVFTALGRQRLYTYCVTVSLGTNIGLDLLLIPFFGPVGAAIGTLAAEGVLFFSGMAMLRRFGGGFAGVRLAVRPLLAGLALGALCRLTDSMAWVQVAIGITAGFAAYIGILFLLQTFTQEERTLLLHAVRVKVGGAVQ